MIGSCLAGRPLLVLARTDRRLLVRDRDGGRWVVGAWRARVWQ